ncbi:MAG: DUF5106 domain-containing protein [Bacteroidales bacterium]|jgi:hypothetical protein|nr:DUF5106 domain-containing protein [Bacteroidales bacterium]
MKKTLIFFSTVIFSLSFFLNASGQYRIVLKIEGNQDTIMLLGNYYLNNSYAVDTAYPTKKGFVFENKNKKLEDGIYFFANKTGKYCEFVVENSKKKKEKVYEINFTTKEDDWVQNMVVEKSKENVIYFSYIKESNLLAGQVKALVQNKETLSEEVFNDRMSNFRRLNDSLKESFVKKYPDHLLTKVLNCTKPVVVPDTIGREYLPDSVRWEENRYLWYKKHYFDNLDFSCQGLLRTPKGVFFSTFEYYWNDVLKYEREDTILLYANKIIERCTDSSMFRYVVHTITERYLKSNVMGHDKIYVELIKKYYKTGLAWWMPPSANEQEVARAEKWEHILLKKQIPNLACPDSNNVWHDVYSLNFKYKLLLFWSPECGHCAVEIPKMVDFYSKCKTKFNLEVMAICTEGSRDEWLKKIRENHTSWINLYGLDATMDWREYFDITTTPQVFILNYDNVIIGKKIAAENIESYLQAIEEGRFKP